MALNNIISKRQQILNAQGEPLSGGSVYLYEPGTTTFITSYQDSGLTTPHTNPVKLSGSGRANIWVSRDCDLRIRDRNGNLVLEELNVNPDALGVGESGGLVPNGSFEEDADANGVPDGWTLVNETGSNNGIDTSESTDGKQSFRFTSTGQGGGSLTVTDFFPVNDADNLRVNVDLRSSVSNVRNIIRVEWYDSSNVIISSSDAYDSTSNPTSYTTQQLIIAPPSGARFAKLKLIGCDPSVTVAGSTWFDRVSVFYPAVVSGVFDNITIQNNEIITTNTNGDLNLRPNGTGRVVGDHGGTQVVRTAAIASGGLEVNNTLTADGWERVLTKTDKGEMKRKLTTTSRGNNTRADDPDLSGFVLKANTVYAIEAYLEFETTSATPDLQMGFEMTGNTNQDGGYLAQWGFNTGVTGNSQVFAPGATAVISLVNGITSISIHGYMLTGAGADTTVDFQWAQNTTDAANPVSLVNGSWMKFTRT